MFTKILFLSAATLLTTTMMAQETDNQFIFPLNNTPSISGSFGEIRPNHFHSGIDFTTNTTIGLPIKAVASGYVSRIKVSPKGYGFAIYLNHDNNITTVYGHLNRYAEKIEAIVTEHQYKKESFEIDIYFGKNEIPVEQGETIGFSGNSGSSGGPHLHFEVRNTKTEYAMSPYPFLKKYYKDITAPTINGIMIYPMSENATIDGLHQKKYFACTGQNGKYSFKIPGKIKVSGQIAFGIDVIDAISSAPGRKCGVETIQLNKNRQSIFKSNVDAFSFDQTRFINAHFDYAERATSGKTVQRSYKLPNNQLDIYNATNNGIVSTEYGTEYSFQYIVNDCSGNISTIQFEVIGEDTKIKATPEQTAIIIPYNKTYSIKREDFAINFPEFALYDTLHFSYKRSSDKKLAFPIYTIANSKTALQLPIRISILIPEKAKAFKNQLAIANLQKGKWEYCETKIMGDSIIGFTRNLGKFTIIKDAVAPLVTVISSPKNRDFSHSKEFQIKITDTGGMGIKSYRAKIDNQWALFEYDAKNDMITYHFNKKPISKGEKHNLNLVVTDNLDNVKEINYWFYY